MIQIHDRASSAPRVVVVSEQIVQSAVNYHVGYKVLHPALQAHNDCSRGTPCVLRRRCVGKRRVGVL